MPPQDQQMQTAPDPRAELDRLRKIKRLRELEAKAGGQGAAPAGPSLRSETDAIIEEAAAAIPGGYEAFNRKPADPQRMAAMGYVPDPLAVSGYAKPRAPEASMADTGNSNNLMNDIGRAIAAPLQRNENLRTAVAAPLQFGQGLGQGVQAFGNNVAAVGTDAVNSAMNIADPTREQFERPRVDLFDKNVLLDEGGLLASDAGIIPRAIGQVASVRVPLGKVSPYGGFGHQAAKDAAAFALSTDYQAPRLSDMISSQTPVLGPVADLLRSNENDPAIVSMMKNLGEDLSISAVTAGLLKLVDGASSVARPGAKAGQGQDPRLDPALAAQIRRVLANEPDAPQVSNPAPVGPKPFSASAEPAGGGLVRRNLDRIAGGSVGATIGGVGDAYAAPGDGNGDGSGPLNAGTGAAIGFFGPRHVASAASRGFRAAARPFRPAGFDERVAAKAVRDALKSGGIRNPEDAAAAFRARFGDKPASVADLTQEGVGTTAGISRLPGATGDASRARGDDLIENRSGRLGRDVEGSTGLSTATVAGDIEQMAKEAMERATPEYNALKQNYPMGSLTSPRLEQLSAIDAMAPHIKAVNDYRTTTAATEGRVVGDFEYWDLVKRDIDAKEQQLIAAGATMDDIRLRKLEDTRNALVQELDTLIPDYSAARQLGGEAPKIRGAFKEGQTYIGGRYIADEVAAKISEFTGAPLTAAQSGAIRTILGKTEGAGAAVAALRSTRAKKQLAAVFGQDVADALQARFAADATIVQNASRMNPNVGSVTSQANMGGGGGIQQAAEIAQTAMRLGVTPIQTVLAAISKSGSYTKAQRDLMGQMLLEGATPENLARIFGNRGGRGGRPAPPAPQGPPTGGGAGPARGPTVPPAPTGAAPRARPAPSEEAVLSAMAQVTKPAPGKVRAPIGPPTRDTIWDGPVPTKPQSLRGWIRSQGGINDRNYMTGDMKAVMGRANGMPGLINRESGTGLDELARKAYQEGFDVDPEDANSLMRLLEEEFGGSPSYRIGAKEEWDAYQDTLRARRGNVPGQTSSSPPMIGGVAFGALTGAGLDQEDPARGALLGGIGGGVLGNRLAKGSRPKAPPGAKAKPGFDQRFMKEAQQLVSYNGGVDKALKAQQYVIDQLKNSKAPNAQDRLNRAVSVQYAIRRMAERSNRELDEIVPMSDAAPTGPKPIDPNTNYNIDPRGDKFVIRTDAGEEVLGAPKFSDRKQALAWLQGETRKARQGGAPLDVAAAKPRPGPPGVKPPPKGPPGTLSRMVAGGAVGGIAGGVVGEAGGQEDLTAEMNSAKKDIDDLNAALKTWDSLDVKGKQKLLIDLGRVQSTYLNAKGQRVRFDDGNTGDRTEPLFKAYADEKRAALEKAETGLEALKKQNAYRQFQKEQNPFFDAVRELGPSGAMVLAGAAATALRIRGVGKSKAAVKVIEKDINDLLTNGPVKSLLKKGGAANTERNRAVNMNEFYRRGGMPDDKIPFNYGAAGYKPNPKAAKPGALYQPKTTTKMDGVGSQFLRPTDIKVLGVGVLDSVAIMPFVSGAEEELKKAKEDVENGNQSIEALRRVEKAKTDLAMYQTIQRIGWGLAGAGALGVAHRYKLPKPDIRGAEEEVAAIGGYLRSIAPPKTPRGPKALAPPPATPPVAGPPAQLLLPAPPPPKPKPKPKPKKP